MTTRDKDLFRPKLGVPKDRGFGPSQGFIRRVLKAAHHSGKSIGKTRYAPRSGQRPGARLGRGHIAARWAGSSLNARSRRAAVKARIVRFSSSAPGTTADHLRYVQREAVGRDGGRGQLYSATEESADAQEFDTRGSGDRHQFRFILSPEDGAEIGDLKSFTRELMRRVESDLGTRIDWVAADHWDTDNPHTHLVIRGKTSGGEDLIMSKDYVSHGLRHRVAELATEWLGERTNREIQESLNRQVTQERWTQIDRTIKGCAIERQIDLKLIPSEAQDEITRLQVLGRLNHLSSLGVARQFSPTAWELTPDFESTLRSMGERGDILRTIQRATGRTAQECRIPIRALSGSIVGRIVGKGLTDELEDRGYLIVDGIDGHAHYVTLPPSAHLSEFPKGAIVEVKPAGSRAADANIARVAQDGIYRTANHESSLPAQDNASSFIAAHVRRLEALRRAGIVERVEEGVWRVPNDLVSQGNRYDRKRQAGIAVKIQSHLPLRDLPTVIGATWLDRELLRPSAPVSATNFGAEVRQALESRAEFLIDNGFAQRRGPRLILMQNLLATLRDRELDQVAAEIETETHLVYRPVREGQSVSGIYRRSLILASGRFALLDDVTGFALVPWRPFIEPRLGAEVSATLEGGRVSWEITRQRGIAL